MTEIYHVTRQSKLESILESGIVFNPQNESWVTKRRELRTVIDKIGQSNRSNWINRRGGVYFWTTLDDAMTYKRVIDSGVPVIVGVELGDKDAWCVDNHEVEFLFDNYVNGRLSDTEDKAEELVKYTKEWNGDRRKRLEVWTQPPVASSRISAVYNRNGVDVTDKWLPHS